MNPPRRLWSCSASEMRRWLIGDPRELWPREVADFNPWLCANINQLAPCIGVSRLEVVGREVPIGMQRLDVDRLMRERLVGGLRADIIARDERGRTVLIESQFGPGDHRHLGQLITYARVLDADVAVWVVVDFDPLWYDEHFEVLAELDQLYAGRRTFCTVAVSVESEPCAAPTTSDPLSPRLRRVQLDGLIIDSPEPANP